MKKEKWLDGMMGLVVGDALGGPVQFMSREEVKKNPVTDMRKVAPFNLPAGSWSDDSSMAIATIVAIINQKQIDHDYIDYDHIMKHFMLWLYEGFYTPFDYAFDIGGACHYAITKYNSNRDWKTCGKTGEYANGNGALMRILPVCLYTINWPVDEAIKAVHNASSLTHNHRRSMIACGIYWFMVRAVVNHYSDNLKGCLQAAVDQARNFYIGSIEIARYERLFNLDNFAKLADTEIESSGYVVHTLEAAVWSLITTDSFEECLLKAVNLGDDADSVGGVAGGLAGLYYGYENIPEKWLSKIQRRVAVEGTIKEIGELNG